MPPIFFVIRVQESNAVTIFVQNVSPAPTTEACAPYGFHLGRCAIEPSDS